MEFIAKFEKYPAWVAIARSPLSGALRHQFFRGVVSRFEIRTPPGNSLKGLSGIVLRGRSDKSVWPGPCGPRIRALARVGRRTLSDRAVILAKSRTRFRAETYR